MITLPMPSEVPFVQQGQEAIKNGATLVKLRKLRVYGGLPVPRAAVEAILDSIDNDLIGSDFNDRSGNQPYDQLATIALGG